MIDLNEVSKKWERRGGWRVAPSGFKWVVPGSFLQVGLMSFAHPSCHLGDKVTIENGVTIHASVSSGGLS